MYRVFSALVGVCLVTGLLANDKASGSRDWSLSAVEQLSFSNGNDSGPLVAVHRELQNSAGLFTAYEAGRVAIRNYREPVITRGATGVALFRSASPAVVAVVVGRVVDNQFQPSGLGSGAIIDARGYVLTNWHVIDGFDSAAVFLKPASGTTFTGPAYVGRVIAQSAVKDLALLRLTDVSTSLPYLKVGDLSQVQVAEDIHIIGHPHGNCWSYTTGVVSQIRDGYEWKYEDGSQHMARVLQIQSAINPGNSGGPVFDNSGLIVGLVAMSEEGQNLDYAIAADEIRSFLTSSMPHATRGASRTSVAPEPIASAKIQLQSAKMNDGFTVTRSVVGGLVSYVVSDSGGIPVAGFVKGTDATVVNASEWDSSGFFKKYSADVNGKTVMASGTAQGVSHFL
jgi:S1-C subfamily serine protease